MCSRSLIRQVAPASWHRSAMIRLRWYAPRSDMWSGTRTWTTGTPAASAGTGPQPASRAGAWASAGVTRGRRASVGFPDGLGRLDHLAVRAEAHEPVEGPGEPAVVGDRDHGALEAQQPLLQRFGRG